MKPRGPHVDPPGSCYSCTEDVPRNECRKSKYACGHHCNHVWVADGCCWCGAEFGEEKVGAQ